MSTIEHMSIQGIRSFGPDVEDRQRIRFFTPLTLILGPNGTGKTTIIECLKYITTGAMPPGCTKGGAFIHDPKVAHEREVKGQVRLQFRDISRKDVQVIRSITATQKGKKVEMKTLDGTISRLNAAGEKTSVNSKCADLDREMITSLGVSKPVLENVIFCHQEDANWPLSEGKQLKEKFDAIFASTRYVKALDCIKKTKKEQDDKLKSYKTEIGYLKQNRDKANQFEADLGEQEAKLSACKESVQRVANQIRPIEDKLAKIAEQADEIYSIKNDITKLTSEKSQMEKHAAELQDQLENEFRGTDDELKIMLGEFQDKLDERQRTLQDFEDKREDLSETAERLGREKSAILKDVGGLEQEAKRYEENVEKRDNLIKTHAREYSFTDIHGSISEEKYKKFLQNMQAKLDDMMKAAKNKKAEFEEQEKAVQQKIDDLRESKTKLEQNERIKRGMMDDNRSLLKEINRKLSAIEASDGKLDQMKRELKKHEHELQLQENAVNIDDLKQEISDMSKDKSSHEAKISNLNSEMNQLHLQSTTQAELDLLKKNRNTKQEDIRRLLAKREDMLKELLGHLPSRNIRGELDEYISKQSDEVKRSSDKLNKLNNQKSESETKRTLFGNQLREKEGELKGLEERVYNVCGSQNFDEGLKDVQEKMEKSRDERGSLLGAQHLFKKYSLDLQKEDPCCPLCHRGFDTEQEVKELDLELQKKLRMVPSKLTKAEREIDEYQDKYDQIMQLKPLKENMNKLKKDDLPQLKTSLRKCQDDTEKLKKDITDLTEQLETEDYYSQMAKDMQPDIVMMDRYYGDVSELDKKVNVLAAKLSGGDSGRTLQMVIDEKEDLQMKVDSVTKQLDRKRQKLNDHSEQIQLLRATINSVREEKLRLENDLQQRTKLEEDKAKCLNENETYNQEITDAREKLRPLQTKIDRQIEEKDGITLEKEDQNDVAKTEVEVVKGHATAVKNVNNEIKSYNQSGKAEQLTQCRARKEKIETKLEKIDGDQKEMATSIDKLRKDLATQKLREHDLQNNMSLRTRQKEINLIGIKIASAEEKLGGLDPAFLQREQLKLNKQHEQLTKERHTADGRQTELQHAIGSLKRELQSDAYRGATDKYRNKMIDFRTTELANGDLNKYYSAMDKAINNYHQLKMEEINKIIRELWRNTYKGNDIETIEIRSDEDDSSTIKTRKVYNYRVVMIKPGNVVIDMRGRCSAGQKVLASLIIRLALAETFCLNCGILALDEPTTNLDRENIESLASALVDIIKGRAHQKNFQLVIITHDEDFVELLGRSDYVDHFFRVGKNQNGCSQLRKTDVCELRS